jgi:nucleoside-diphosphate-sugar epimerase
MPQTIALTGATGFLGRHLLNLLLERGCFVTALVRNPEALCTVSHENLKLFKGDLSSDLSEWMQGADCVIHLAGLVKAKNWQLYQSVNIDGAGRVAEAAEANGVKRFVLMSSMAARAPELSYYAKSKLLGEKAVSEAFTGEIAIVRAPAVFGPGDQATKPIFDLIAKGLLPTVGGKNWQDRSVAMVYAPDLAADLCDRAIMGEYDGQTVSPSTIGAMTMPEFASLGGKANGRVVKAFAIPLAVIYPIAALTTVTLRLFSIGHLSLGKLAEFRYEHWQSNDSVTNPTSMVEAIKATVQSYENSDT